MTVKEFEEWRTRLHFNKKKAAELLGLSANAMTSYCKGRTKIPKYIALACDAIALGLKR